jgi:hypothetical protein
MLGWSTETGFFPFRLERSLHGLVGLDEPVKAIGRFHRREFDLIDLAVGVK